ncbi:MAG: type IV toxin-antitoxin system AbiEi family antitoxin domain-containing protein [Actinomycetota bacterium]
MDELGVFLRLMRDQAGVATTWQARSLGVTRGKIRALVDKGVLERLSYGLLASSGTPRTFHFRAWEGLLAASSRRLPEGRAAMCGPSAAVLQDLVEPGSLYIAGEEDNDIHILTTRRMAPREGYRFHWSSRAFDQRIVVVDGLWVTDGPRTFLDMCDLYPFRALSMFRRGLRKQVFTREEVIAVLDSESRQGRGGLAMARDAIERTDPSAQRAKSYREDRYFDLLVAAGYPPPQRNVKIMGSFGFEWEVDLYYPKPLAIDISPLDTHADPLVIQRDQRKVADLNSQGIPVVVVGSDLSDEDFLRLVGRVMGPPWEFPRGEMAL